MFGNDFQLEFEALLDSVHQTIALHATLLGLDHRADPYQIADEMTEGLANFLICDCNGYGFDRFQDRLGFSKYIQ